MDDKRESEVVVVEIEIRWLCIEQMKRFRFDLKWIKWRNG
jgi:hypothetical protein